MFGATPNQGSRGRSRKKAAYLISLLVLLAPYLVFGLTLGQAPRGGAQGPAPGEGAERSFTIEAPAVALTGSPFELRLHLEGEWPEEGRAILYDADGQVFATRALRLRSPDGDLIEAPRLEELPPRDSGQLTFTATLEGVSSDPAHMRVLPAWLSILPPLLAILLAILAREVVLALVAGVWLGAFFVHGYEPLTALLRTADTYAVGALADADHASIAVFSLLLGGMIGVIARAGGAQGMAKLVTRYAQDRLRGALATWALGLLIFFDDYSNSLLVGTTMRPITDRLRISREKLAFLVDATAAPVSSFALVSSWVGVEIGYISDQYSALGLEGDAYVIFLQTIPHRFYPILMLVFGLALILMKRDFGPMYAAELRAITKGHVLREGANPASDLDHSQLAPKKGKPVRWVNAIAPIVAVICVAMVGMYTTGEERLAAARAGHSATVAAAEATLADAGSSPAQREAAEAAKGEAERQLTLLTPSLRSIFGKADSLKALLWAALIGGLLAILLAVGQGILTLREAMDAWLAGLKSISFAVLILVLAWSLQTVCSELSTARFVISAIGGWLPAALLPATVFAISALVSFATGTSWGTMGILFPLVVPLAHRLAPDSPELILGAIGGILSGSVWGDHCSPISDTTIMSSMASSCDHIDHVRTQLPYALGVGILSLFVGELATGLGLYGPWVGLLVGCVGVVALVRFVGRPLPEVEAPTEATTITGGFAPYARVKSADTFSEPSAPSAPGEGESEEKESAETTVHRPEELDSSEFSQFSSVDSGNETLPTMALEEVKGPNTQRISAAALAAVKKRSAADLTAVRRPSEVAEPKTEALLDEDLADEDLADEDLADDLDEPTTEQISKEDLKTLAKRSRRSEE